MRKVRRNLFKKRDRKPKEGVVVKTTLKGQALLALVEAGLLQPSEEGNFDIESFNAFWESFEQCLVEREEE